MLSYRGREREREEKKETRDKIEHIYIRLVVAKEPALHEKRRDDGSCRCCFDMFQSMKVRSAEYDRSFEDGLLQQISLIGEVGGDEAAPIVFSQESVDQNELGAVYHRDENPWQEASVHFLGRSPVC